MFLPVPAEGKILTLGTLEWHFLLYDGLNEYEISFWSDESVLELDSGDGCKTLRVYSKPFNCPL